MMMMKFFIVLIFILIKKRTSLILNCHGVTELNYTVDRQYQGSAKGNLNENSIKIK